MPAYKPQIGDIVRWFSDGCEGVVISHDHPLANKDPSHQSEQFQILWNPDVSHHTKFAYGYSYIGCGISDGIGTQSYDITLVRYANGKKPKIPGQLKSWIIM